MASEQKTTKVRKKIWLPIVAPAIFNNYPIGETLVWDTNSAVGKHVSVNLMELTGDIKSQSYTLDLRINKIADGKAHTEPLGYYMSPSSVRRLVRRNKDKIDLSFVVETADNIRVRVKPFAITKNAANLSVLHAVRRLCVDITAKAVKKLTFEAVMQALVQYKLQQEIKRALNKIYPLKIFEIRSLMLTTEKPTKVKESAEAAEKESEEEQEEEIKSEETKQKKSSKKHESEEEINEEESELNSPSEEEAAEE